MNESLSVWLEEVESELTNNILAFWKSQTIDNMYGGFIGGMNSNGEVEEGADKSLVLNARILWTFAAAYRRYGKDEDLRMADRALEQLTTHFLDKEYGGFFWMIKPDGTPSEEKKQVYGQAFVIYALAEYVRATDNREPLSLAEEIYRLLERYAYDPVHTGYIEALSREWSETDDLSLSGKDLNERKSMNTHLHVLEAYTNLYRIWKPEGLRLKLKELIEVHLNLILDSEAGHFKLFFDDAWNSQSKDVSYGHDIEGSWLLWEAAEVLGDHELLDRVRTAALLMAKATLVEGTDEDGAVYNELHEDGRLDDSKDWWPQAEAMVGYLNAYQLSKEEQYLTAAQKSWNFIREKVVDPKGGEWHWQVSRDGKPNMNQQKVGAWKCPYHNSRACLEAAERLGSITKSYALS
ncbi:AGE family epimerase/isomerase [Neobacillus mesonae]|nr:AGE family epimerase/isomerase [Neobacillus mesonae]